MSGRLSTEQPRWSPDGKATLFTTGSSRIYILDLPGAQVRFLTHGHDPEWCPDGHRVAFVGTGRKWEIGLIAADGTGEATVVEAPGGVAGRLVWDPQGRYVLFADARGQPMVLDAGEGKVITAGIPGPARLLAWSPNGRWVAFAGPPPHSGAPGGLYLFHWPDQRVSLLAPVAASGLFWSRDSSLLHALVRKPKPVLLRCDLESGSVQQLRTPGGLRPVAPAPTGDEVLYAAQRVPGDLSIGRPGAGRLRSFAHGYLPAWSADGDWIAFYDSPDEDGGLCTQRRTGANFTRWLHAAPPPPARERLADAASWGFVLGLFPGFPALLATGASLPFLPQPGGWRPWALLLGWLFFFVGYRHALRWSRKVGHGQLDAVGHALAVLPAAVVATLGCWRGLGLPGVWLLPVLALWGVLCAAGAPILSRSRAGSHRAIGAAWAIVLLGTAAAGVLHSRRHPAADAAAPAAVVVGVDSEGRAAAH